jgi:alcohol dehydrogenase
VIEILSSNNIKHILFDRIEENPSLEVVDTAAEIARKENIDFLIAIGGGFLMDALKAIGLFEVTPFSIFYSNSSRKKDEAIYSKQYLF